MSFFFFFNDTATTEIYTLSLHDALPISRLGRLARLQDRRRRRGPPGHQVPGPGLPEAAAQLHLVGESQGPGGRSEEHTSELQSQSNLVCRLLLEKKKK